MGIVIRRPEIRQYIQEMVDYLTREDEAADFEDFKNEPENMQTGIGNREMQDESKWEGHVFYMASHVKDVLASGQEIDGRTLEYIRRCLRHVASFISHPHYHAIGEWLEGVT